MNRQTPMYLLSGMATDERLFEPQLAKFDNLHIPRWIEPGGSESIRSYARRMAKEIDPGAPCVVGGASFGGIIALEMAEHLNAVCCVLIGSIRSPREIPWRWRALAPIAFLGPDGVGCLSGFLAQVGRSVISQRSRRRLMRLADPSSTFLRWSISAVLRWRVRHRRAVPVLQIHGEHDEVLPVGLTRPDVIVPHGRHALTLFNSRAVNEFLSDVLQQIEDHTR